MWRDALSMLSGFTGSLMPRLQVCSRSTTRKSLIAVHLPKFCGLFTAQCNGGAG